MQNEAPPPQPKPDEPTPLTNEPVQSSGSFNRPADYYATGQPPAPEKRGGCPKWAIVGCGGGGCLVLLVILIGGTYFLRGGMPKLLDFAFSRVEREISTMSSAEVTVEQKDALRAEMTRYRENIRSERIAITEVQPVLQQLQAATGDSRLTGDEVTSLTATLKAANDKAAGITAPPAPAPVPAPAPAESTATTT